MKTIVWWSTILCTMSAIWSSLLEERAACEYHLSLTKYPKDQRVLFSFCYLPFAQRFDHLYHIYQISKNQKNQRVLFAIDHYLSTLWIRANDHHLIKLTTYPKIQISWHLSSYLSAFTLPTREIITGITWSMIILRTRNASRRANTNSHLLVISRRPSDHIEDKEFFSAPVLFRAGPTQSNSYEFSSSQYFCPGASSKF